MAYNENLHNYIKNKIDAIDNVIQEYSVFRTALGDNVKNEKENETSDISAKPPLPPSHGDNRGYQDKIVKEETTAVETTHTTKVSTKEESPEPALSSTAPALAQARTVTYKEKLTYSREYLIELRECPSSLTKPVVVPDSEIILDKPLLQIIKSRSHSGSRQNKKLTPQYEIEIPWKLTLKQLLSGKYFQKPKSLEAEILFIMNRLTPTNFELLAVEMMNLNITTYEDLQELVKTFFDKVTIETQFVESYALLCKIMAPLKVPPPANMKDNQSTFRVVMLTKCQQEFEADKAVVFEDPEEKKKKIESEMPEGPERLECVKNTLYQMKMRRLKFYGNIRFVAELFKLGMLTENIMHDCIYRLLKARDDVSLVSLCILLTTVGQLLDTDKAKKRMDQYFQQLSKLGEQQSAIKVIIRDVIDLRNNNWVPRKEQAGPKKIDEVHKDFQQEQFTKQLMQSQPPPPTNDNAQPNSRRESRLSPVSGAVKKMKPLSRAEMENKAKIILEEFLSIKDLKEAKLCLKELEGQTYLEVLVSSCINAALEKSKKERDITGQFFHEMVKNNLISVVIYFKGLSEILQFAEDMVIDIPMIWTYLAQLIAPVLIGGSVPWSDLIQVLQTSLEKSCCLKLLTEILLHAKNITSEADVARMWQSSNFEWSQFVDQPNVTKFLEDKKLQFTIAPVNESQLTVPTSLGE